jgi:hypothetical protein
MSLSFHILNTGKDIAPGVGVGTCAIVKSRSTVGGEFLFTLSPCPLCASMWTVDYTSV